MRLIRLTAMVADEIEARGETLPAPPDVDAAMDAMRRADRVLDAPDANPGDLLSVLPDVMQVAATIQGAEQRAGWLLIASQVNTSLDKIVDAQEPAWRDAFRAGQETGVAGVVAGLRAAATVQVSGLTTLAPLTGASIEARRAYTTPDGRTSAELTAERVASGSADGSRKLPAGHRGTPSAQGTNTL